MPTFNSTTKTTYKPTDGKEHRSDNKRLAPFFCRRRNTEKRRQAPNRYRAFKKTTDETDNIHFRFSFWTLELQW
jgi:hypothetical protein